MSAHKAALAVPGFRLAAGLHDSARAMPKPRPVRLLPALLILCLALAARPAAADELNRNFMPFGERAAFLGNAGITSELGEAVFYNPANLSRIKDPNISVSGNLYARFEVEADPLLVIEGEDQPFRASGFFSNPSTLVSTYRPGGWSVATAVLIPEAVEFRNRVTFDSPSLRTTLLQEQQQESLWIGAGVAREIAPGLAAGIGAFVIKESASELLFVHSEVTTPATVSEFTSSFDFTVWNLSAIAGLSWQPHPKLGLGVRTQPPPLRLTGSGDIYRATVIASAMDSTLEEELEDVEVSRPLPWDIGAGLSFRPTPRLELVLDANLQLPATLTRLDDPRVDREEVDVKLAPRVGAGVEWQLVSPLWLRFGVLYNRSSAPEPQTSDDEPREHYYGVTGGIAWQKGRTQTSVGGFLLRTDTTLLVAGSDPVRESEDARTLFYGALLAVTYRL